MKNIRIGNDFVLLWAIERNNLPENLTTISDAKLKVKVFNITKEIPFEIVDTNKLRIEFTPEICNTIGVYNLKFSYTLPDEGLSDSERECTIDYDAFTIVSASAQADDSADFSITSDMAIGFKGDKGDKGDSAYDIWISLGNIGTEEDFIKSLKGEKGEMADVTMSVNDNGHLIAIVNPTN